jgi:hypothetical protein
MPKFALLTVNNPKTAKGDTRGYLTAILHLAPWKVSGVQVCPMAETFNCHLSCLNLAGRGGIAVGGNLTLDEIVTGARRNRIQDCRIKRTQWYARDRDGFMRALVADIAKAERYAAQHGLKLAVRLNGTSDIRWESVPVNVILTRGDVSTVYCANSVIEAFPHVPFYDYTKIPNRWNRTLPANYHLTFSYSAVDAAQPHIARVMRDQPHVNLAVVFRKALPAEFMGRPVLNGDETDLRFLDAPGAIVGLTAKGLAKRDRTGFVVD